MRRIIFFNFLISKFLYSLLSIDNCIYESKMNDIFQIESDIPRCHQYHFYFNSYIGKLKLYNILNNLLNIRKDIDYFQGMDAMAATCLECTNFNEELACIFLNEIIQKCMKGMFNINKNPLIMKEQLLIFKNLLMFLEPDLSFHLNKIGFLPELYAVSWFLNIFSSYNFCF